MSTTTNTTNEPDEERPEFDVEIFDEQLADGEYDEHLDHIIRALMLRRKAIGGDTPVKRVKRPQDNGEPPKAKQKTPAKKATAKKMANKKPKRMRRVKRLNQPEGQTETVAEQGQYTTEPFLTAIDPEAPEYDKMQTWQSTFDGRYYLKSAVRGRKLIIRMVRGREHKVAVEVTGIGNKKMKVRFLMRPPGETYRKAYDDGKDVWLEHDYLERFVVK